MCFSAESRAHISHLLIGTPFFFFLANVMQLVFAARFQGDFHTIFKIG